MSVSSLSGPLRRLHPLTKGIGALGCLAIFGGLAAGSPVKLAFSLPLLLAIACFGGVEVFPLLSGLRKIWVLILVVGGLNALVQGGQDLLLMVSGVAGLVGIFLSAGVYLEIASQGDMVCFCEWLYLPLRVFGRRDRTWALATVVGIRFLPGIAAEMDRLRRAQIARGIPLSGAVLSWRDALGLLVPAVVSSVHRAGNLALAMELRGFQVTRLPTRFREPRFGVQDGMALLALVSWMTLLWLA